MLSSENVSTIETNKFLELYIDRCETLERIEIEFGLSDKELKEYIRNLDVSEEWIQEKYAEIAGNLKKKQISRGYLRKIKRKERRLNLIYDNVCERLDSEDE